MRIISGIYRGRSISVPTGVHFRPTTGKVKEALFSTLESMVSMNGLTVLDLYAGSGAFGFEALSHGASFAVFVEANSKLTEAIKKNAEHLEVSKNQYMVIKSSVEQGLQILQGPHTDKLFDVIFCDPPYEGHPGEKLIKRILEHHLVKSGSIIIIESKSDLKMPKEIRSEDASARLSKERQYGQTTLRYYDCMIARQETKHENE